MPFEVEKRKGKLYIKAADGEHEITEKKYLELQQKLEYLYRFGEKAFDYSKNKNWSYAEIPENFSEIINIDILVENLENAFSTFMQEGKNPEYMIKTLDIVIGELKAVISNPLLKDKVEANNYFVQKLKTVKTILENIPPQQNEKAKPELTINQIALKYVYLGNQVTRENGNEIAKEYGHNSGEKLFQRFTYYSSPANRTGKPNICTPKKLNNKIELIESVIELLPINKQERAKDEVLILKNIYEAEYQ